MYAHCGITSKLPNHTVAELPEAPGKQAAVDRFRCDAFRFVMKQRQ